MAQKEKKITVVAAIVRYSTFNTFTRKSKNMFDYYLLINHVCKYPLFYVEGMSQKECHIPGGSIFFSNFCNVTLCNKIYIFKNTLRYILENVFLYVNVSYQNNHKMCRSQRIFSLGFFNVLCVNSTKSEFFFVQFFYAFMINMFG